MAQPRILVSNDDGIQAEGINALAQRLDTLGEVWVVAPDRERSATSHSISLHKPLRMRQVKERWFCVDGTPTDSVYLALHHVMREPPDVVVSGINHGPNLGSDVIYSGTVSAAMEAAVFGYRALAVSLCDRDEASGDAHFETAAQISAELLQGVLLQPMPQGVLLNVNVPCRPREALLGIKLCRLGYTNWSDKVDMRHDPRGKPYYWIGAERGCHADVPHSDYNAIEAGYVTVTPIHYDVTDYRAFHYVRGLKLMDLPLIQDDLGDQPLEHPVHPIRKGSVR